MPVGVGQAKGHGRSSKTPSGAPGRRYEADVLQTIRPGGNERELAKLHWAQRRKIQMSGKADEIKGRVKEAAGDLTDDQDLKDSGKADEAAGKIKQKVEHAVDKVRDAVKKP
jgi:uncharacterized protein YjbJ (UPF0337 family)